MSIRRSSERLVLAFAFAAIAPPLARAQDEPKPEPAQSEAPKRVGDISARYRLTERYAAGNGKPAAGAIGQFQVAFRETISGDDPREKGRRTIQAIYSERPVQVGTDDRAVTDSVRHYATVALTPDPWKDRKDAPPLKDLTIWYRTGTSEAPPLVMVLTPNHTLREEEYRFAISYEFATNLAFLLPETPVRLGDSWKLGRTGATALVNNEIQGGGLTGKLTEILAHPTDPSKQVAILSVTGRVVTGYDRDVSDTGVNARVEFSFTPERGREGVIDAAGGIAKVLLAQVSSLRVPTGAKGVTVRRDLNYERRVPGDAPPLAVPSPAPAPTPENSWLTFTDRDGHYHLRHPQGYQPDYRAKIPNGVDLRFFHAGSLDDLVRLTFVEKPEGRPEAMFDLLVADWKKQEYEVQRGLSERLPEADWPGMSVYHLEASLKAPDATGRGKRRFFDAYVLQFPRDVSLYVSASTFQDPPEAFRAQVRAMLKTVTLGAPEGK